MLCRLWHTHSCHKTSDRSKSAPCGNWKLARIHN